MARGWAAPIAGMSHSDWWLATSSSGPERGTFSTPRVRIRSPPLNSGPAQGRTTRQKVSPGTRLAARRPGDRDDPLGDLLGGQVGRVDHRRVRRRRRLLAVQAVALDDRRADGVDVVRAEVGRAPRRPHVRGGDQEHLDVGVRPDDRPGVAALEHRVLGQLALPRAHPRPHLRVAGHGADVLRDDLGPQVGALGGRLAHQRGQRLAVVQVRPAVERHRRQLAVHRAGVHIAQPQALGDQPRHGALAGAGRPVDGDHHVVREPTRVACNNGVRPRCYTRRCFPVSGSATETSRTLARIGSGPARQTVTPSASCCSVRPAASVTCGSQTPGR